MGCSQGEDGQDRVGCTSPLPLQGGNKSINVIPDGARAPIRKSRGCFVLAYFGSRFRVRVCDAPRNDSKVTAAAPQPR